MYVLILIWRVGRFTLVRNSKTHIRELRLPSILLPLYTDVEDNRRMGLSDVTGLCAAALGIVQHFGLVCNGRRSRQKRLYIQE